MSKSRLSRLLPRFLRGEKNTKNTSDAQGSTDNKTPCCFIHFLDDSQHQIQIKGSWKGSQLQDKVFELLGLHEKDYFSVRFVDSAGQTHWLDGNKSLSSQFKGCQLPYKLYFGVKFYAADPCKLREEITRYLFFLQVKQDILQGRLPITFDEAAELCAYAVQSELGDFDPRHHTPGYVSEFCFIQNQTEELEARIAAIHRRLSGLVPLLAEYRFLDKVKWLDMYGVDLHPVLGEGSVEYFLGLTPTGIVVYKNKNKVGNYFWPRINKVTFKGKIFIIKVKDKNNEEHAYAFELARKTACKHLWKCCVEHHAFFRLNQTQERNTRQVHVSRSLSSNRRSGRSERQAVSDNLSRQSGSVNRLPSRRQPRRINSDSGINARDHYESQYHRDTGMVTMVMKPEPVRAPRHRSLPELQGRESPRSVKSAPWETNFDYGLYTTGKESPVSARSDRMNQQRNRMVSGSDSESGISQRRKYFPNRRGSDNESDVSVTRRRRRDVDSDSASDISSRYPASQGHERMKNNSYAVLYPFHDKENRPNGSIPSLHSAPAGEAKQRRRRRRSKSPGKRPPEELKRHFEYGLKETEGMSEEQLREIPFVNVETKSSLFKLKYSPKLRQKVKAAKQKSLGDLDQNRNQVLHRETSAPLQDNSERDMSVHSQPLGPRDNQMIRDHSSVDHNTVGRSKSFTHRPHSYHQSHNHVNNSHPPPSYSEAHHYSNSQERQNSAQAHSYQRDHTYQYQYQQYTSEPSRYLTSPERPNSTYPSTNGAEQHYQSGSASHQMSRSPYSSNQPSQHTSLSNSQPTRKPYAASNSSLRSARSHHHHPHPGSASYPHPPRSQGAYESDNNSVFRADDAYQSGAGSHSNYRSSGRYSRNRTVEREPHGSLPYPQYSNSRSDGPRSGQTLEDRGHSHEIPDAVSGYQFRERDPHSAYPATASSSSRPFETGQMSHYRDSAYGSPAQSHSQQPPARRTGSAFSPHTDSQQHLSSANPSALYSTSNCYDPGRRPGLHGQTPGSRADPPHSEERPALPPRSGHQEAVPQSEPYAYRPASRLQYDGQPQHRHQQQESSRYVVSPQRDQHDSVSQRTPPQYRRPPTHSQRTPPRNQGTSTQNQGTPPRHLNTPPRRMLPSPGHHVQAPYSHGLYLHTREQSEGSSSQTSAVASFQGRPFRPSPNVSERSGSRNQGSNFTQEMASHHLQTSVYNAELCTEL